MEVLEGQYQLRIGRRIGRGGFAEVYEASSPSGVPCAIKVSLDPLEGDSPAVQKELENLELVKLLSGHPHLVSLLDYWVISGYLVTRWELATEGSLLDVLKRYQAEGKEGIPPERLVEYLEDAAEGIDYLNLEKGIYHRDIKPQNLLVFHGRVKVGDLGLVKFVGATTASHTGFGTLGYLPPEAFGEHRLSRTVDLYGLAASYVKLRTGREPFGEDPVQVVKRQLAGDPVVEGLGSGEAELVRQALAADPEARPQGGARKWVRSLAAALAGGQAASSAQPGVRPAAKDVAEAARAEPRLSRVRVALDGSGDVALLEEALQRVGRGGTIELGPGTHRLSRPLKLTEPVKLVGAGVERTRVVCDGEGYVLCLAGRGPYELRGIDFQHLGERWANVAVVEANRALIEACRFAGGKWDKQNKRGGSGLWVKAQSFAVVRSCIAEGNDRCGIEVAEQARPTLEENQCRNNEVCGIGYFDSSGGNPAEYL